MAADVVCSGAFTGEIHVWNVIKGDNYCQLKADDTPTLLGWNPNGTLIGATTKNKFMNIFDPRANKMVLKQQINEAFQSAKFAFLDNETFVTTSWTKSGAKMLKLWDVRKVKEDLTSEGEVSSLKIDTSKTVTTPFVDRESKLLYCIGKGEAGIHVFDYNDGTFRKGINYSTSEPALCSVLFDRKCLDYNTLEVDRFARYVNSHKVFYVSFNIPRRNPGFDPTLYPPVEYGEAALTYDQWTGGETAEPKKKEINTIENKFVSKVEVFVKQEVKVVKKTPEENIKELEGKIAEMSVKVNQLTEENAKLKKQIQEKKAKKVKEQKPEEPKPKLIIQAEEQKPEEPKPKLVIQAEEPKPEEQAEKPKLVIQAEEPKPEEQAEEQQFIIQAEEDEQKPEEQAEEPKPEEQTEGPKLILLQEKINPEADA